MPPARLTSAARAALVAGLLLLGVGAGARTAAAQEPVPPPRDTVRIDSAGADSARVLVDTLRRAGRDSVVVDTIQPPLPVPDVPPGPAIGAAYRWSRDELFASGAFSLLELVDRLPEVVGFRAGWLLPPEFATVAGGFGQIRVYLDGVEIDAIDPRNEGLLDLALYPLWPLEEVAVERAVDEVRIHLRSWRVDRVEPYTRIDVATGDYNTDLYRGFYGKRFSQGAVLQLGGQQFSTRDPQFGGDGDRLSVIGRIGVARESWSVDAWVQSVGGVRQLLERRGGVAPLSPFEGSERLGYLRAAWRDPLRGGLWAQAIAAAQTWSEQTPRSTDPLVPIDTVDSTATRAQYVASVGWTGGPLRLSGTARVRSYEGARYLSPMLRAAYVRPALELSAFAERRGEDESLRLDVSGRTTLLGRFAVGGGLAYDAPEEGDARVSFRAEGGYRLGDLWVLGGAIVAAGRPTGVPVVLDPDFVGAETGEATGIFAALRGTPLRNVTLDVTATRWNEAPLGFVYRPEFEVSGRAEYFTRWLSRFPRGNFGFRAALFGNYMTEVGFPTSVAVVRTVTAPELNALLEIRISDAVINVQYRNVIGLEYETVPNYLMPRPAILYGVRWTFSG